MAIWKWLSGGSLDVTREVLMDSAGKRCRQRDQLSQNDIGGQVNGFILRHSLTIWAAIINSLPEWVFSRGFLGFGWRENTPRLHVRFTTTTTALLYGSAGFRQHGGESTSGLLKTHFRQLALERGINVVLLLDNVADGRVRYNGAWIMHGEHAALMSLIKDPLRATVHNPLHANIIYASHATNTYLSLWTWPTYRKS